MLEAGCDDVVRKPFRDSDLFAMLEKHLDVRFVYESFSEPDISEQPVVEKLDLPHALAQLTSHLLSELKFSTGIADIQEITRITQQLREENAALADILDELIREFNYAQIVEYIEQIEGV